MFEWQAQSQGKPVWGHSRPQSPSFLGHVVGKRGAATGRLQIKPSGSGDENGWRAVQIETNGLASVGFC